MCVNSFACMVKMKLNQSRGIFQCYRPSAATTATILSTWAVTNRIFFLVLMLVLMLVTARPLLRPHGRQGHPQATRVCPRALHQHPLLPLPHNMGHLLFLILLPEYRCRQWIKLMGGHRWQAGGRQDQDPVAPSLHLTQVVCAARGQDPAAPLPTRIGGGAFRLLDVLRQSVPQRSL